MGAMQSRPPLPSQASLFDPPPGPDTLPDGLAPAMDDAVPEAAQPPTLPLPGFLAEAEAQAVAADADADVEIDTSGLDSEPAPPADAAEHAQPDVAPTPPPIRPAKTKRPLWARVLGRIVDPWLKLDIEPEQPGQYDDGRLVCYVLEDYGLSNALILERACREAGLPSPLQPIPGDPLGRKRSYVALSRRHANTLQALGLVPGPEHKTHSGSLARLLEAHRADPALDVQLVPVSIFVGQAPNRSSGWFSVLF